MAGLTARDALPAPPFSEAEHRYIERIEAMLSPAATAAVKEQPANPATLIIEHLLEHMRVAHGTARRKLLPRMEQCQLMMQMLSNCRSIVTELADDGDLTTAADDDDEEDDELRGEFVANLRQCMVMANECEASLIRAVRVHQRARAPTSRAGYLRTLDDLIGPEPAHTYQEEWTELRVEAYRLGGPKQQQYATHEYVLEHNAIEGTLARNAGYIDPLVAAGWERPDADTFILLSPCRMALSRALTARDPCYAASCYALNTALFRTHVNAATQVAPPLYVNLSAFLERGFHRMEIPDRTGFQGLTSTTIVKGFCYPECFTDAGYCHRLGPGQFAPQEADVICFQSRGDDEHGCHSAIMLEDGYSGCFPLNTLFKLREVHTPGSWRAPNGTFPQRKLLVVTATYLPT